MTSGSLSNFSWAIITILSFLIKLLFMRNVIHLDETFPLKIINYITLPKLEIFRGDEEVWSVFIHFVIKIMFEDFFFVLKELIKSPFVKL
jgi:hypothetical protein